MPHNLIQDYKQFIESINTTALYAVKNANLRNNINIPTDFFQTIIKSEAKKLLQYSQISKDAQNILNTIESKDFTSELISSIASISDHISTPGEDSQETFLINKDANRLIAFISKHSAEIRISFSGGIIKANKVLQDEKYVSSFPSINFGYTMLGFKLAELAEGIMMAVFSYEKLVPFGTVGMVVFGGKAIFKFFEAVQTINDSHLFSYGYFNNIIFPYQYQESESESCLNDEHMCRLTTDININDKEL